MPWFVYMLRCGNGSLYTGITTDLARRVREHQTGKGGRFTRAMQPVELVYREPARSERHARRREAALKAWSRARKLTLLRAGA